MPTEKRVIELDINDVLPNRFQPRIKFNQGSIEELAESIKKYGVIQPIVVRKIGEKYEIIAGERRYKASVLAGKRTIPAIINEISDKESVEIALIENVQREDLTPIEKAVSYKKILDMGYMNQEELAQKVGKSQSTIANTLRLLGLSEEVQEALLESKISERHARSLLKLKNENDQKEMLNRIINERLTVRKTDEEIENMIENNNERPITIMDDNSINNQQFVQPQPMMNQNFSEVELPPYSVPSTPIHNDEPQMPGFMDINKIEETAQDILQPERPAVDMNSLLQPDANTVVPQPVVEEEKDEDLLRPGKFFNFFEEENNAPASQTTVPADNFYNNQPANNGMPTFNFEQPATPVQPEVQTPVYETPTFNFEQPVAPVQPEVQTPAYEAPTFNFEQPATPVQPEVQTPAYEAPTFNFEQPVAPVQPEVQTPVYEAPTFNFEQPVAPVQPEVQTPAYEAPTFNFEQPAAPVQPEIPTPLYEESTFNFNESTPVQPETVPTQDFGMPSAVAPETLTFDIPTEPSVAPVQPETPAPTNTYMVGDMRTVVNTVREMANTIEKYGFKVDVEEIDFEDSYQVIVKIDKK